jgi:AraC-like DNA-binding protein
MTIFIYDGFVCIRANELNVATHKHTALQVTLALNGGRLKCETPEGQVEGEALLIPPLSPHCFHDWSGAVLILLIDTESIIAESVKGHEIQTLNPSDFAHIQDYFRNREPSDVKQEDVRQLLFNVTLLRSLMRPAVDERVQRLVEKIKNDDDFLPSADEAARDCHLSESRFLHLFKEELGLPFRKYLQWIKLRRGVKHIQNGRSLTEAAHAGGFTDSSHLSRFFTETFGLNPSEVLKNSQFMQVK